MERHWDFCWRHRDRKEELLKEYEERYLPTYLEAMDKRLEEQGGKGYIAGDKITIADMLNLAFATSHMYNPLDDYSKMH